MKEFSCGDVVPGCTASFRASTDGELMMKVAAHAHDDHGLTEISSDLADAVKQHIRVAEHA